MANVLYMTDFEFEMTYAERVYEIAMQEIAYMESLIENKLRIDLAKCELKIFAESSVDDTVPNLVHLFSEAEKEAAEAKQSVFSKIWSAMKAFFINTWNAIQKVFTKEDTEAYKNLHTEEIEAPCNLNAIIDEVEKIKSHIDGGIVKKVGIGAAIATSVTAIGVCIANCTKHMSENKPTKVKKDKALNFFEWIKGIVGKTNEDLNNDNLQNQVAETENKNQGAKSEEKPSGFITALKEICSKIFNPVINILDKIFKKEVAKETGKDPSDENKGTKNVNLRRNLKVAKSPKLAEKLPPKLPGETEEHYVRRLTNADRIKRAKNNDPSARNPESVEPIRGGNVK